MNELSEHLYWVEDTCSIYAIRSGDQTLLIDCGTSWPLKALGLLGM